MKRLRPISRKSAGILSALLLGAGACEREAAPPSAGPALTANERQFLGEPLEDAAGRFSYRMPREWVARQIAESPYAVALGPKFLGYVPNIRVSRDAVPLNFDLYLGEARKELERQSAGSGVEEDLAFVTSAGLAGRRWITHTFQTGDRIWHAHYLFPGPGEDKIVVSVSAAKADELRMSFVADACLKTLVIR